ncbi:MAG: hypothetical protein NTW75_05790 [Planctomycetales bacterium]|jgi:hypothetical protein|nr:hypothetical protein [Planctomycetales bacterium]
MNNMTTAQANKFVYLCGIVLLLIPIIWLGLPSDGNAGSGGKLSQLRTRYELGESDLGDIDPSGAAMNLVLLGMRGVAVNLLWIDLDNQKNMKRWSEMQAVTESIVRLQPHFDKIWEFNGWNLAYNTSAEWDAVPDRYFWVKAGGKFIKRGVDRNRKSTHLQYHLGNIYQKKIGIADESKYYRKYFLRDPDPKFNNGPDRDFNPDEMDNYLVAKKTFLLAMVKEQTNPQHILDISLFKTSPARCQFDYAVALQKDGLFGEQTREAWQDALNDWTLKYGREFFQVKIQDQVQSIQMEMTRPEIKAVAKSPDDVPKIAAMIEHYRKMVNYYYWRTRGTIESERETSEAHRDLYEGAQLYKKQELAKAQESLLSGMQKMESLLKRKGNESLADENDLNEECLLGVLIWIDIHRLVGEQIPERFPLDWLKAKMEGNAETMNKVNRRLRLLVE